MYTCSRLKTFRPLCMCTAQAFHCPGTFPIFKSPGLSGSLGPVLAGPRDLQGLQVLSCQDHRTQDLLSRGSWGSRQDQIIFSFFLHVIAFFDHFCCCITRKKSEKRIWPSICSVCRQVGIPKRLVEEKLGKFSKRLMHILFNYYTKLTSANSRDIQGAKKGPGGPGTFLKGPGTSGGSLGPVLPGPRDLQGLQVPSCPVLSRDLPGTSRDGTVLLESLVGTRNIGPLDFT